MEAALGGKFEQLIGLRKDNIGINTKITTSNASATVAVSGILWKDVAVWRQKRIKNIGK